MYKTIGPALAYFSLNRFYIRAYTFSPHNRLEIWLMHNYDFCSKKPGISACLYFKVGRNSTELRDVKTRVYKIRLTHGYK